MNFKAIVITAWIWFPALTTAYDTVSETFLVCDSPECIERAKIINESLNTSVDPCTDFYSYVCDRWESNHSPPDGRKSYDVYQETRKDIPAMLHDILGNITRVESQTIIEKVATMYNACLALPDTGYALIRVLNESGFNAWPILTEENINSANSKDLLRHMTMSAFLYVEIGKKDPYDRKPVYGHQIYIKPKCVPEKIKKMTDQEFRAVINSIINLLYPGTASSNIEKLTNQLVKFVQDLSNVLDATSQMFSVSQLEKEPVSNIPIYDFLKKEFEKVNVTLKDTQMVNVAYTYCMGLSALLKTTDPYTLYNYAGFLALFPYLEFVQMSSGSELTLDTTKGRKWSECITLLEESTRDVLDYLYVTNQPNHLAIKYEVEDIASRLIQAFNETLQSSSWLDTKTREALEKELKAPLGIGYPEALLNMSALEAIYKYVPYLPSNISFTEAFYYFQENLYKMQLRKFGHPEEIIWRWVHSPREGRTKFHEMVGYDIEIPYPVFVSPIYQRGLPRSLNYGGIGGIIARELGVTFSISDMYFLPRRYRELPGKQLGELFESRASCLTQQYTAANNETLGELYPGVKLSRRWGGTNEDLADNTGLQTAFKAYSKVLEEECANVDTRLTGLENITGMQLFFISSARTQCRITDKNTLRQEITSWSPVTPARNRVNEAMKNLEGFAKAFNCSVGSRMRPTKPCPFW